MLAPHELDPCGRVSHELSANSRLISAGSSVLTRVHRPDAVGGDYFVVLLVCFFRSFFDFGIPSCRLIAPYSIVNSFI